jgi:hypothetical protein
MNWVKKNGMGAENILNKEKWRTLVAEERPLKEKAKFACVVALLVSLTFHFFGPIDVTVLNIQQLPFMLGDILWALVLKWFLVFLLFCLIAVVLKGRLFDLAYSLFFSFAVAGYMQAAFMNLPLGVLDGSQIAWHEYAGHATVNVVIWLLILLLPLVLYWFNRGLWQKVVVFSSVLLIAIQIISTGLLIVTVKRPIRDGSFLTSNTQYEISAEKNIVVLLLDHFSVTQME